MAAALMLAGLVLVAVAVAAGIYVAKHRRRAAVEAQVAKRIERQQAWEESLRRSGGSGPTKQREVVFRDRRTRRD